MVRKKNAVRLTSTDAITLPTTFSETSAKKKANPGTVFVGQALLDALDLEVTRHVEETPNLGPLEPLLQPGKVKSARLKKRKLAAAAKKAAQLHDTLAASKSTVPIAPTHEAPIAVEPPYATIPSIKSTVPIAPGPEAPMPVGPSCATNPSIYGAPMAFMHPLHQSTSTQAIPRRERPVAFMDPMPPRGRTSTSIDAGSEIMPPTLFAPIISNYASRQPTTYGSFATQPRRPFIPYHPVFSHTASNTASNITSSLSGSAPSYVPVHRYNTRAKSPVIYSKRPQPEPSYIIQASLPPTRLPQPQPLLLINDLNGALILRNRTRKPKPNEKRKDYNPGLAKFKRRLGLSDFLDYIYTSHTVMIWTSAMPSTCMSICDKLLNPEQRQRTVKIWARDKLDLNVAQFKGNAQVFKRLTTVWSDETIQMTHPWYAYGGRWGQTNTLLIDDSTDKAAAQPFNLINIPELTIEAMRNEELAAKALKKSEGEGQSSTEQEAVLRQVAGYIEEAKWYADVSTFARSRPFKMGDGWGPKGKAEVGNVQEEPELSVEDVAQRFDGKGS